MNETQIEQFDKDAKEHILFKVAYFLAYVFLLFYGVKFIDILLPEKEFLVDWSDKMTLNNASCIISMAFFVLSGFMIRLKSLHTKSLILLLHPAIALMLYMVCLILLQPVFIHASSLEVGKCHHMIFIDGNARKVLYETNYKAPHYKGKALIGASLYGRVSSNSSSSSTDERFTYSLVLKNQLYGEYKNFILRFYLYTLIVSVDTQQTIKSNPPPYVVVVPDHFKDENLELRNFVNALPIDQAFVDVPYQQAVHLEFELPRLIEGKPITLVHNDYVDIEMEILPIDRNE